MIRIQMMKNGVGGKMKVGDLVKMKEDPHNVVGVVTEINHTNHNVSVKVIWIDALCDPSWASPENLETI